MVDSIERKFSQKGLASEDKYERLKQWVDELREQMKHRISEALIQNSQNQQFQQTA